ncbi:hypothetical protein [Rhizobium sp. IMFF44]|uniref:hypothetical protein n=1 Tax=Rhizobium sp. IMFF44 TaxID=3342350 RepID=UPI0035B7D47C
MALKQEVHEHPDFRFADAVAEILAVAELPKDLTGLQTERALGSVVAAWSSAKGYNLSDVAHSTLVLTLMQLSGYAALLYRRYIDASHTLDDVREDGGDLVAALGSYISSAIAYGNGEIREEVAELRRLIAEREAP